MKRLAVDYGKRRAGLAVTDNDGSIVMPYMVIYYKTTDSFIKQLLQEVRKLEISEIIFGLPLNMDGTESEMSKEVRRLAGRVEKETSIRTILYDERLTTFEAKQMLTEQGVSAKRQKDIIDMYAAYCILKSYISERQEKTDA